MIVSIPKELLKKLERIAQETVPYEACGLLLGDNTSEFIVRDCVVTDNVTTGNKKRSFEIDPGMHLKFQREARDSGLKVIGVWHSHPNGVAELSETDKKQSMEPSWLWLVTAVSGGMSEIAAFVASKTDSHAFSSVGIIVSP